jgi:hypothetical protein
MPGYWLSGISQNFCLGWSPISQVVITTPQVVGLQAQATMPGPFFFFFFNLYFIFYKFLLGYIRYTGGIHSDNSN